MRRNDDEDVEDDEDIPKFFEDDVREGSWTELQL